jgi:hypothetical protein
MGFRINFFPSDGVPFITLCHVHNPIGLNILPNIDPVLQLRVTPKEIKPERHIMTTYHTMFFGTYLWLV